MNNGHNLGGIGFYKRKPTAVGGKNGPKVSTLSDNGWSSLADVPKSEIDLNL